MIEDAKYLNLFDSFSNCSAGGECSGVRDSVAEEPAPRAYCSVLWLSSGPRTEETHHFC